MVPEEGEQNNIERQESSDEEPLSTPEGPSKEEAVSDEEKAALSADALSDGEEKSVEPTEPERLPSEEEQEEPAASLREEVEQAEVPEVPADTVEIEPSPAVGEGEPAPAAPSAGEQIPGEPTEAEPPVSEEEQEEPAVSPGEEVGQAEVPEVPAETVEIEPSPAAPAAADLEESAAGEVSKRRFRIAVPSRKATVSVAAGLLAAILVAGWLTAHTTRPLKDFAEIVESGGGLLTPLDRAKTLMENEKYASARNVLQGFVGETQQGAERSEGLFLLAKSLQALQDEDPTEVGYTEARETYRKAIEADPSSLRVPEALKSIAETYLVEQMHEEARKALEELVRKYPDLPDMADVEFRIADTYLMQKDGSAAIRKLRAVIADYPDSEAVPHAKLLLGKALELEGEFDRAARLYRDVLGEFPDERLAAEAQERLGDVALESDDHREAIARYAKRVEMTVAVEDNDRVMLKLARSQGAMGDWKTCAETCRTMLMLFDKSELEPEVISQLCRAEQEQGRLEAAIQYAYEGHAKFPKNAPLVKNLAGLYFDRGDYGEAAQLYDEAVKLAPDDPQAWFRGGAAHFEAGNLEASHRDLRELTKRFPSDALAYDAHLKLADIYCQRGDPERAIDQLSSRLHDHVVSARRDPILSKIATIYHDLGLPGQAADAYAKMLDGIDDDEVFARMGIACFKAERWDAGLRALRQVDRSRIPEELAYDMFVEMGVALRSFGNLPGAIRNLETAVKQYPAQRDEQGVTALLSTYLAANKLSEAEKLVETLERWASCDATRRVMMAQARLIWGDSLFSRGNYAAALKQFTGIVGQEDAPGSMKEWATYQKGNSYLELSRYAESAAAYEEFLIGYPSSSWKKAAQTKLSLVKLEVELRDRGL
jgi:tetratricopeptide (TPR) repeat protein